MTEYMCELEDARYEMEWAPKEKIVRCKDCIYLEVDDRYLICRHFDNFIDSTEGFCAWGYRK